MLVVDLVLLFILAAILRRVMRKSWAKWVQRIGLGSLAIFLVINLYRTTLPLPYLQYMIDKIPAAVSYFEEHKAEIQGEYSNPVFYNEDNPSGPMVNMLYVYVESPEKYPQKTGQISRTEYIHPINEQWYLWLYQGHAN